MLGALLGRVIWRQGGNIGSWFVEWLCKSWRETEKGKLDICANMHDRYLENTEYVREVEGMFGRGGC
jgi:hypothetical protein